jgi:8-oxo-dGTP diphosphatase
VGYVSRMAEPKGPSPTVDLVIALPGDRVVLVKRKHPPPGWAMPGGFVDVGETVEAAAIREAREETGLAVELVDLVGVYSDPRRDPRRHTTSTVFLARADGAPAGADDAEEARAFGWDALPAPLAFDHAEILRDARRLLLTGARRKP